MSILFSNFAVRKDTNYSPPETRIIGHYMLHAEFHVFNLCDVIATRQNIADILETNGECHYNLKDYGLTIVLEIGNMYSYSLCNYIIEQIEKSRVNHRICCYLSSIEFRKY